MAGNVVWKGLAHVRPGPTADFTGRGAFVNVLVLARDEDESFRLVGSAMEDHGCELFDMEIEPLESESERSNDVGEWRDIAAGLSPELPVWCEGTFYIHEEDEEDGEDA